MLIWELGHKENRASKNWCFWIVVLEKTLDSPLASKDIKPVNPKGNKSWVFIVGINTEYEGPILWLPDAKSQLIGKDSDAGKDWRWEEKGMTEEGMDGWHHWLNGLEFERGLGYGEGEGNLGCYSSWGHKDQTWLSDWTTTMYKSPKFWTVSAVWPAPSYSPLSWTLRGSHC